MSLTNSLSFITANQADFTFDSNKIAFSGSNAALRTFEVTPSLTLTNMSFASGVLTKTGGSNNVFDAQAFSSNQIASSGFVQFKPSQTNASFFIGLSADNADASFESIDYAMFCFNNGNLIIYENGVEITTVGTYATSDVLRIEVSGGEVRYLQNGSVVYTSLVAPTFPLFMDSSFGTSNAAANSVVMNVTNVNATKYPIDNPTILEVDGVFTDDLISFVQSSSSAGSDAVKFVIQKDGVDQYWNGSAWASSSGYAQSNTGAEVVTNIGSLSVTGGAEIKLKVYLHSNDGSTTPSITSAAIEYDFAVEQPAATSKCIVYCFLKDLLGEDIGTDLEAKLVIENKVAFNKGGFVFAKMKKEVAFNDEGYAEVELEETASVKKSLVISLKYKDQTDEDVTHTVLFEPVVIPNQVSASLIDIAVIA